MPIKKLCSYASCHKVIDSGVKYCSKHEKKAELEDKKRYKEYKYRRELDKDVKKEQDFYKSSEWIRSRVATIADCYGIDIYEYYTNGRVIQGERVHHILELHNNWSSRLDCNNLIYLTEKNHRNIHERYKSNKKIVIKELFYYLKKFNNEFY